MKTLSLLLLPLFLLTETPNSPQESREAELDKYWADFAIAASKGDIEGMKAGYHEDAVLVKPGTTISVTEAFKYRWKKEIMEVKDGIRQNQLEFRFSKRVGNDITAYETGIFHYTSIETKTGKTLADAYVHFENLMVKSKDRWVTLMEYQKERATLAEWNDLK